jgi:hypothetical protein
MLKYQNIIRRFCHHHSRDMFSMPKLSNPLVECEYKCNKKKTEIQQIKTLPIQVQYSKNKKLYTIVIEITK